MSTNVVNLDALIPREDLAVQDLSKPAGTVDKITIPHLNSFVFAPDLRKPHFQRETNQWTPKKVVELVTAFIDRDLIPAVILWRAGHYIFVIDGAHRLSALLAWIHNDYGDGQRSSAFFGGNVPDDQRKVAEKTRKMVDKAVGSYKDYIEAQQGVPKDPKLMERVANLADCNVIAQWVPTPDAKSAEDSFFKINQAATPIDPTERRILRARDSASAIAARAITNAGTAHKYWSKFGKLVQAEIEEVAKTINEELYLPPITSTPINTLDVPVAGRGYNALPFVFDLVNEINGVIVKDSSTKKDVADNLPPDPDGQVTLGYLKKVRHQLTLITTDEPRSLGLHPVVYFYTRGGTFKSEAFLAVIRFINYLDESKLLKEFHKVRAQFEEYLIAHKEAMALIVHKYGTGERSIPWLYTFYRSLFENLAAGHTFAQIDKSIKKDHRFAFLSVPPPPKAQPTAAGKSFSASTKTAAYFAQALQGAVKCSLCGARVHKNSMHIDHKTKKQHGGHAGVSNAQVTHPYCDSSKS
jgi:uncharacterized protein DUF262/HNH endonuclease